jgi:hypothetical protein
MRVRRWWSVEWLLLLHDHNVVVVSGRRVSDGGGGGGADGPGDDDSDGGGDGGREMEKVRVYEDSLPPALVQAHLHAVRQSLLSLQLLFGPLCLGLRCFLRTFLRVLAFSLARHTRGTAAAVGVVDVVAVVIVIVDKRISPHRGASDAIHFDLTK